MKTRSCWGTPPSRLYRVIRKIKSEYSHGARVCVIGASDGKFVFPFLRNGFHVTAYEIDDTALLGGTKEFPIYREKGSIIKQVYKESIEKPIYHKVPIVGDKIDGLIARSKIEGLQEGLQIRKENFYKFPPRERFDVVFTSCSIPYECNLDIPVKDIMAALLNSVAVGGYLYMDYMMPLEDRHSWKPEHYFRTGEMKGFFAKEKWDVIYLREMSRPIFEAAHVDRPEDHFHRFGYVMAKKLSD